MPRINLNSKEAGSPDKELTSLSWTVLILIVGSVCFSIFQIVDSNRDLADVHTTVMQLHSQVEAARRNEVRLHALADGVLALAPHDPIAARLVNDFKIHDVNDGTSVSASIDAAAGKPKN